MRNDAQSIIIPESWYQHYSSGRKFKAGLLCHTFTDSVKTRL